MGDPLRLERPTSIRVDSHVLQRVDHSPIQRILAFLNLSIDDVIDDPIARVAVHFHWRVDRLVQRRCAAVEAQRIQERAAAGCPLESDDLEQTLRRSQKAG